MRTHLIWAVAAGVIVSGQAVHAQTPKTYQDGDKGVLTLPLGDLSFADQVTAVTEGEGKQPVASAIDAQQLLGPPDFTGNVKDGSFLTLGCGGAVEVAFIDNALTDVNGPDLYVFEVGPDVEGTFLAVSIDGETWIDVGEISGGRAEIDLADSAAAGGTYRALRLTDDASGCSGRFPGADIDAIAAIGSELRFTLDGEVLFDSGSSTLKDAALADLRDLAREISAAGISRFEVIGHTDNVGSDTDNQALSLARADAVKAYLGGLDDLSGADIVTKGAGESEPVATNDTDAGRAANRRVEIIARSGG